MSAVAPMLVRSVEAGGFLRTNRSFATRVGWTDSELAEKPLVDWLVAEDRDGFCGALGSGEESCRVRHVTKDGGAILLEILMRSGQDEPVVVGRCAEGAARIASAVDPDVEATVKSTLHQIARIVEEQNPGYKCSILLVAHGRFVAGAGPSLPDEYNNAIDGFAIGPHVGSCGTAIYWNVPVIVEDIQADPLWVPFAELARRAGVAACWSHPFTSKHGRVLGALAFYSPSPCLPTAEQLGRLRAAAQLTGLAVERGRAEEELRSANEVKARFMANLSHEIRTPLNALIGITDFLEDATDAAPESEMRLLREAGEQLLELFTGALELTEVRDRHGHEPQVVELPAFCQRIHEPFEASGRSKGLEVECRFADSVPRWATLDAWSFERALKLLVHNAVKFTSTGAVTTEVEYVGERLCVRVTDTGCGIDLERLGQLREPFVQGDLSTTKRYAGFGLGLALTDLCLQALGGELEFSANMPKGTVASFSIPVSVARSPIVARSAARSARERAVELPVLVVEDNPLNCRVIERLLQRVGYECQVRENGEEALRALSEGAYSCILMDCQMPVMDGYEATRRIRQREAGTGEHIPIIAVTANALAEDRELCLQAGMDDYLKKPVRRQELVSALEEYAGCPRE